jgi:5-formyltetrahydrofolate cyclo-ligase
VPRRSRSAISEITSEKTRIRAEALARRQAMPEAERAAASAVATSFIEPLLRNNETVSLFWPMGAEIDPRSLIGRVRAKGGRIAMPVIGSVAGVGKRMFFRLFDDESDLEDGVFGTRHPNAHKETVSPDLVVAPLAAFDRAGNRIGYGAGYYDRAIADLQDRGHPHRLVGIAFACQEVTAVPVEAHDRPLQFIATERELIGVQDQGRSQAGGAA